MITLELAATEPRPTSATGARDLAEFDERFELVRDRLVRVCIGLVGASAAEDVVHDAYLRGRQRFGQLREMELFDGWITRIAINLCMNRHRSGGRLRALLPRLAASRTSSPSRDLGLRELIEQLPPRERTLVVLHYGHGYRIDEVARMTGLTDVNARTIIHRARRRLADAIDEADR